MRTSANLPIVIAKALRAAAKDLRDYSVAPHEEAREHRENALGAIEAAADELEAIARREDAQLNQLEAMVRHYADLVAKHNPYLADDLAEELAEQIALMSEGGAV